MVHTERRRTGAGQWIGLGILAAGAVTGRIGPGHLLLAAWLENVSVGLATVVAILRAPGRRVGLPNNLRRQFPTEWFDDAEVAPAPGREPASGTATSPAPTVPPPGAQDTGARGLVTRGIPVGCALPFFLVHYGIFTLVHGAFVGMLVAASAFFGASSPFEDGWFGLAILAAAAIARSFRRLDPATAIGEAYSYVIPLHLAIFVGFFGLFGAGFAGWLDEPSRGGQLAVTAALLGLFWLADHLRARRG